MSFYTIELRHLVNMGYELNLKDYPIFSEEYRPILNDKIIKHFYFREIGSETADRFNFRLGAKMGEIMPYYNLVYQAYENMKLYSKEYAFSPFALMLRKREITENIKNDKNGSINSTTEGSTESNGQTTNTSTDSKTSNGSGSRNWSDDTDEKFSDTPSSPMPTTLQNGYLTTRKITDRSGNESGSNQATESSEFSGNGTSNSTTKTKATNGQIKADKEAMDRVLTEIITGQNTDLGTALRNYTEALRNVDKMILRDLEPLFMSIWPNE